MRRALLLSGLFTVIAPIVVAQRPLAGFNNEARKGIREFKREKARFEEPERRLTATFSLGDTLENTPDWNVIRMYEPGGTFSASVRIECACVLTKTELYIHNPTLEVILCHSTEGLTPGRIETLADSLQNAPIRIEQCTTDNALNAPQNCASYAFECILRANGMNPAPFFTWKTVVPEESLSPLLERLTVPGRMLTVAQNRAKWSRETQFTQNGLYVCYDASERAIHLFFYRDGRFWSKNGGILPHVSYDSVLSILKHYDQTATIGEYTLRNL